MIDLRNAPIVGAQPPPRDWRPRSFTVLGLDVGKRNDHMAGVVLERKTYSASFMGPQDPRIRCLTIRRWELMTNYCVAVRDALELGTDVIVVEMNGVGEPVIDMMRRDAAGLGYRGRILPVMTAASHTRQRYANEGRHGHRVVPKVNLVSSFHILASSGLLRLPDIPETKILHQEFNDFQMRVSQAAHQQFGNAPGAGKHDDIIMSMSLACWYMLNIGRRELALYC